MCSILDCIPAKEHWFHAFQLLQTLLTSNHLPDPIHDMGFPGGSEGNVSAYNARDLGLIPGSGRSPGEGNGNPLQYSCLENPMDGEAWLVTVHGVAKNRTRLSNFTFTSFFFFMKWTPCLLHFHFHTWHYLHFAGFFCKNIMTKWKLLGCVWLLATWTV